MKYFNLRVLKEDLPIWLKAWVIRRENNILPEGYTQIEYIKNTGTQYINTKLEPSTDEYSFNLHFKDITIGGSGYVMACRQTKNTTPYAGISGAQANSDVRIMNTACTTGDDYRVANYEYIVKAKLNKDATGYGEIECLTTGDVFTGKQNTMFSGTGTNLTLFAFRSDQIHKGMAVYSLKIWNDKKLVRNFIPVIRNSNNKAGLYDLANHEFYENVGTGNFIAGGEV